MIIFLAKMDKMLIYMKIRMFYMSKKTKEISFW